MSYVRRNPLLSYYVLTFAISWGGFVVVAGPALFGSTDWRAEGSFLGAVIVMLAGPSLASLLLTGLADGRAGYRELLARLRMWRADLRWYVIAVVPAPVITAGVLFALALPPPLFADANRAAVFLAGLGAGVTTVFEEIGWTGFVVPRLRLRYTVLRTGLIVGVLWGVWHLLQQIFISGTYAGGIPQPLFLILSFLAAVASLTAYRVLMVWLFDSTHSLFVTTVMHGMLTASSVFWFTAPAAGWTFLANVWLVAAAMWLFVGVVAIIERWRPSVTD